MEIMQSQLITILVPYNADEYPPPATWDWTSVIDSADPVTVLAFSAPAIYNETEEFLPAVQID